ncbi:hypothetical protein RUND412_002527 [Rhizina undulata]
MPKLESGGRGTVGDLILKLEFKVNMPNFLKRAWDHLTHHNKDDDSNKPSFGGSNHYELPKNLRIDLLGFLVTLVSWIDEDL